MSETHSASDWATTRGEKWRAQLTGMEAMIAPVDEPLIEALELNALKAPSAIADVGCGGGGTTFKILRRAPPGSTVHGFDVAPTLIEAARARAQNNQAITFHLADVATAAAPAERYNRIASRFGIMFFDDPPAAFTNLFHWLIPNGRFAFAAWADPVENTWKSSIQSAAEEVIAVPPSDPSAPGPFRYADANQLLNLLKNAGFSDLKVNDWHGTLAIGGGLPPAEAAHFAFAALSSFGELLAKAGNGAFAKAHQSLTKHYAQHTQSGIVRLNAAVHIFSGAK